MANDEIDLTGISVEGKELTKEKLRDKERRSEIAEEVRKEINGQILIRRRHPGTDKPEEQTKKVVKRVRYLTDNEIRKEYGIMEKPFGSDIENILHVIATQGPVDTGAIEIALEKKKNALSGILSRVNRRLGTDGGAGLIKREMGPNRMYVYEAIGDWNAETAYRKMVKRLGRKPNGTVRAKPKPAVPPIIGDERFLGEVLSKILGIEVKVSGRVEIVFGWKKF